MGVARGCFIDYAKAFDCVDHNKLWKTLKEMGIPDHVTCFLRNLYAGQEATVNWTPGSPIPGILQARTLECTVTFPVDIKGST